MGEAAVPWPANKMLVYVLHADCIPPHYCVPCSSASGLAVSLTQPLPGLSCTAVDPEEEEEEALSNKRSTALRSFYIGIHLWVFLSMCSHSASAPTDCTGQRAIKTRTCHVLECYRTEEERGATLLREVH